MTSENGYDLEIPFIVCESEGGPYRDDAFVAGFWCGSIDHTLVWATGEFSLWVPPGIVPQIDLIAMNHGWTITSLPWAEAPDEHCLVTFTPGDAADA